MRPSTNNTLLTKPQNVDTTNVFSPSMTDNISPISFHKDEAVRIIEAVLNQNKQLEEELKHISPEMTKIASLGEYLVNENKSLRFHYHKRTDDIKHLLETLKINANQNNNDLTQQIHLLKASNLTIFKEIQKFNEELDHLLDYNKNLEQELAVNKNKNITSELQILNNMKARLENKLNQRKIDKLTAQSEKLMKNEKLLFDEVINLGMQVGRIWRLNAMKDQQKNKENFENVNEKDKYRGNIVTTLKSINNLVKDKEQLKGGLAKITSYTGDLQKSYNDLKQQVYKIHCQKEEKNIKLSKLYNLRAINQKNLQTHKIKMNQLQVQRLKKSENLEAQQNKIKQKSKQLQQIKAKNSAKIAEKEEFYDKQILELKNKITAHKKQTETQIAGIRKQIDESDQTQQNLTNEYNLVENDCYDYQIILGKMENPVEEIERAELILNIKKNKPMLTNLINRI